MLARSRFRPLRILSVALAAAAAPVAVAAPAAAHSILITTDPAPGAQVASLDEVRFEFAGDVAPDGHTVIAVGPGGEVPASTVEKTAPSTLLARFGPDTIEPGQQEIRWEVVGGDGHTERGIVTVTVTAPTTTPPPTTPSTATAPPGSDDDAAPTSAAPDDTAAAGGIDAVPAVAPAADDGLPAAGVIALVVLVAVIASGLAYGLRRRRRHHRP